MSTDRRLIVVSNRLPVTLRRAGEGWRMARSSGGLATALGPLLKEAEGLWIGWPGEPPSEAEPRRQDHLERWSKRYGYVPVDLPSSVAHDFYEGYANQVLWPLFHNAPATLQFGPEGWDAYVAVNERFRDAVLAQLQPHDLVWVHDYHLMLLPRLLREARPDAAIGFFLHIPFPASDTFRMIPRREEILQGLLGADLLAFQTHGHLQHFRECLLRIAGVNSRLDRIQVGRRVTRLEALPIGIAPVEFADLLQKHRAVQRALAEQRARFAGQRVLLAVDRLDYTKGIPHRLRAFRRLLLRSPALRGSVVLVQVAVPSREAIPRYEQLRHEVSDLVGEINGEFGTPGWTPIVYMRRGITRPELVALYASADVGWVTPLCDGMNLVSKEYVACQTDGSGVLVLSEFAGAAEEMGEAFLVNPYDEERGSDHRASPEPRAGGASSAHDRPRPPGSTQHRVPMGRAFPRGPAQRRRGPTPPRKRRVGRAPCRNPGGGLREGGATPRRPRLRRHPRGVRTVAPRGPAPEARLRRPFGSRGPPRHDPRLDLGTSAAGARALVRERPGAMARLGARSVPPPPGSSTWASLRPAASTGWKTRILPVLDHFMDRTPGSFVEEKEHALVWHYRMAEPEFGDWLANELVATLEAMLASTELRAVLGKKTVEVRPAWANKGAAVAQVESLLPPFDFRLAIGDDRTDEDLFEQLPRGAWTIHVGDGSSRARFRVEDPAEAHRVLARLVQVGPPMEPAHSAAAPPGGG